MITVHVLEYRLQPDGDWTRHLEPGLGDAGRVRLEQQQRVMENVTGGVDWRVRTLEDVEQTMADPDGTPHERPRWAPERIPGLDVDTPYGWAVRDLYGSRDEPYLTAGTWRVILPGRRPWIADPYLVRIGQADVIRCAALDAADALCERLNAYCWGPA